MHPAGAGWRARTLPVPKRSAVFVFILVDSSGAHVRRVEWRALMMVVGWCRAEHANNETPEPGRADEASMSKRTRNSGTPT